jgi:hypothetical protein
MWIYKAFIEEKEAIGLTFLLIPGSMISFKSLKRSSMLLYLFP